MSIGRAFKEVARYMKKEGMFLKGYKNTGAPNTKKGGTQFKNISGGGWLSKALSGVVKKRLSTVRKKRSGMLSGTASKIVKKK